MSNTVAPPLSLVPMASRSNAAGSSFSLAGTGGNFDKAKALIDGAVGKQAEVCDVRVEGLPGSVEVAVKPVVASGALLCELVVVDFLAPASRRVS
eukprot:5287519-Pleurochrysis_carterae.AAC.1